MIETSWLQNRILRIVVDEGTSQREFKRVSDEIKNLLDYTDEPVFVIQNVTDSDDELYHFKRVVHRHQNVRQWIFIGDNSATRSIAKVLNGQLVDHTVLRETFFPEEDEAVCYITERLEHEEETTG